jgi:hypothetical protein
MMIANRLLTRRLTFFCLGLVSVGSTLIMRALPFRIATSSIEGLVSARTWSYNSKSACRSGKASLFNNLSQATCVGARKSNSARAYANGCLHPEV